MVRNQFDEFELNGDMYSESDDNLSLAADFSFDNEMAQMNELDLDIEIMEQDMYDTAAVDVV